MATMELDPLFVKALGFLRSKNKESADQLRDLLDEVIAGKGGAGKSKIAKPTLSSIRGLKDKGLEKTIIKKRPQSPLKKPEEPKRDSEKRTADRAKLDTSDSDSAPIKKSKVERPQRQAVKPIVEDDSSTDNEDSDDSNHDSDKDDTADTNTGGSTDADDFALELGLACVVCKKMDVSAGNQLIECQECHSLYHQQCHKPPATNADPNDPRLVWYCAKCARTMKRQATKKPKSLPTSGRDSKGFEKTEETTMNLFKRSEPKTVSPSGTSKQPLAGLASMAANLSGRPSGGNNKPIKPAPMPAAISQRSQSSTRASVTSPVSKPMPSAPKQYSSASSSSKSSSSRKNSTAGQSSAPSQTSQASAMKRLQMMKKKASKR